MRGSMALFLNPVIPLTEDQRRICISDFDWLEFRLKNCGHRFYRDTVINACSPLSLISSTSTQTFTIKRTYLPGQHQ